MNTNYIKHFLIVIVLAMQGMNVFAETAEMSPVYLYNGSTPKLDGLATSLYSFNYWDKQLGDKVSQDYTKTN